MTKKARSRPKNLDPHKLREEAANLEIYLREKVDDLKHLQMLIRDAEQKVHRVLYALDGYRPWKTDWPTFIAAWHDARRELESLPDRLEDGNGFPQMDEMRDVLG